MTTRLTAFILGCTSLALFLSGITTPTGPYYDEPLYIPAARAFLAGANNPNPEAPPLGKLFVAAGIRLFGDNPLGWRIMSAVFGSITLVALYLWTQLLLDDFALALTAAMLTLFNNFLFVMSRVAMMDIYLLGFTFCGLLFYTLALKIQTQSRFRRRALLALAGIMFGLSCACKWNGVDALAVAFILGAVLLWSPAWISKDLAPYSANLREVGWPWFVFSLAIVPIAAYGAAFWPLFHSLNRAFSLNELADMNLYIWRFHRAVKGNAPIISQWYSWPLQFAPQRGLSYLVGNWFLMWGGLVAIAICARRFLTSLPETMIVALYAANLLQWAVTPQTCLYYYYYFPAACFLCIAIPTAIRHWTARPFGVSLRLLFVIISLCIFAYCYPRMAHLQAPYDCMFGCWN